MTTPKYQTIDPILLQTLNLNQKRIHHIFDILHGRDSMPVTRRPQTERVGKSSGLSNGSPSSRLPRIVEQYDRVKSPRQMATVQPKGRREFSGSLVNKSVINTSQLTDIKQQSYAQTQPKKPKSLNQPTISSPTIIQQPPNSNTNPNTNPQSEPQPPQKPSIRQRLLHDYGFNHQTRRNKSLELNPKDIYRLEIEGMVAALTEIEDLEDAEKLMKRVKRRYQHLRKFDKGYYSRLGEGDIMML